MTYQFRTPRRLNGLIWAEIDTSPFGLPKGLTSAQKAGLQFERHVRKKLKAFGPVSPWIRFQDLNGFGGAQPDIVLPHLGVVIECKLSNVAEGEAQLLHLYLPLLRWISPSKEWKGLVLVKHWAGEARPLVYGLRAAKSWPPSGVSFMLGSENLFV